MSNKMDTLKELRKRAGLTPKEVAGDLHVHIQMFYNYEKGVTRLPLDLIIPLADKYDVKVIDIVLAALTTLNRE